MGGGSSIGRRRGLLLQDPEKDPREGQRRAGRSVSGMHFVGGGSSAGGIFCRKRLSGVPQGYGIDVWKRRFDLPGIVAD